MKVIFTVEISDGVVQEIKDDLAMHIVSNLGVQEAIIKTARDVIADRNEASVEIKE